MGGAMCKSDVSSAQLPSSDVSSAQPSSKLKAHLPPHRAYARGSHTELERSPKRLILIRHGESMGNVDSKIYCTQADNQVTQPSNEHILIVFRRYT